MVLDTGSPVSAISPGAHDALATQGLLWPTRESSRLLLAGVTVNGQSVPDIVVRSWPRLTRLQADGLLGLEFLRSFRRIVFEVDELLLTLEAR